MYSADFNYVHIYEQNKNKPVDESLRWSLIACFEKYPLFKSEYIAHVSA